MIEKNEKAQNKSKGKKIPGVPTFVQKCILLASIKHSKYKILLNSFDNIPIVKLYSAGLTQEKYIYTKIKGALLLFKDDESKIIATIYDLNTYSQVLNVNIDQKDFLGNAPTDKNFISIPLKYYYLGFKFASENAKNKFVDMVNNGKNNKKYHDSINFKVSSSDEIALINNIKADIKKKSEQLNFNKNDSNIEKKENIFLIFNNLYGIIKNIEFDESTQKFNIFINRSFNENIVRNIIEKYKMSKNKHLLPIEIIYNDYNHIANKNNYIEILINNMLNNIAESKVILKAKMEHQKKLQEEKSLNQTNPKNSEPEVQMRSTVTAPYQKLNPPEDFGDTVVPEERSQTKIEKPKKEKDKDKEKEKEKNKKSSKNNEKNTKSKNKTSNSELNIKNEEEEPKNQNTNDVNGENIAPHPKKYVTDNQAENKMAQLLKQNIRKKDN